MGDTVAAETYRMMHDIAVNDLGYESILEALEATPHASLLRENASAFSGLEEHENDDQRELARLYNHQAHDGPQFNRAQMRMAIHHGRRLMKQSEK